MNNKQFNLLTTLNLNCNDQRWSEFMFCVSQNLQNELIEFIYIGIELDENNQKQLTRYKYITSFSKKVSVHKLKNRPTFTDLFTFCNTIKGMWIISNADIYFPKTNKNMLSLLLKRDYNRECFVLSRYNILEEMQEREPGIDIIFDDLKLRTMHGNNSLEGSSIDSWIFETPFDFSEANFDIELGVFRCDSMMNHQLLRIREVSNPCLSVISIHKHLNWTADYKYVKSQGKTLDARKYLRLMRERGHKFDKIKFSNLKEDG